MAGYTSVLTKFMFAMIVVGMAACNSDLSIMSTPIKAKTSVDSVNLIAANEGQEVKVKGSGFKQGMTALVGDKQVPLNVTDANNATFVMPASDAKGIVDIKFYQDDALVSTLPIFNGEVSSKAALVFPNPEDVCSDVLFSNEEGQMTRGLRVCATVACTTEGQVGCTTTDDVVATVKANVAAKVIVGETVGGVVGTYPLRPLDCSADGAINCVAVPAFKAAQIAGAAAKIASGDTLGGVAGTAGVRPSDCSVDGAVGCVTVTNFPAVDKVNVIAANAGKVRNTLTIAGVAGTLGDCATDGGTNCVAVPTFPAIDKANSITANASKMKTSLTILGVPGTLADCNSDGGTNCVAIPTFPAANASGAAAKIQNSLVLAGITGTGPVRPADCGTDGGTNCVAIATFPAIDKANSITANASKIRNSVTILGVPGTLADCNSDGGEGCVSSASFPAANATGAAAKIQNNLVLAGITGTGPVRPSDCATDGGTNCVAVTDFPAVDKVNNIQANAAKIRSTVTIASVPGTLADCSTEGGTTCVAVTDFPAVDKVALDTKKAGIRTTVSVVGVAGTFPTCSQDGDAGCAVIGPTFATALTTNANLKIITGQTVGGVSGSVTAAPADCTSDSQTGCVTVADFPAVNKSTVTTNLANIRSTVTVGGQTGTMGSCASGGSQSCYATGTYYAATSCAANGSNCYLPTYNGTTNLHKAVDASGITAGLIKSGSTVAGVTGDYPSATYPLTVGDGIADITTANFATKVSSASDFGWFDRNGQRYSRAGSADLAVDNIVSGKTILGFAGTVVLPDAWDVRYGKSVGASTGKMKYSCRNGGDIASKHFSKPLQGSFDLGTGLYTVVGHSFSNNSMIRVSQGNSTSMNFNDRTTYYVRNLSGDSFQVANASGGTSYITQTATRNDLYFSLIVPGVANEFDNMYPAASLASNPWGTSEFQCGGLDTAGTDPDKVWVDTTTGGCNGTTCVYKDRISNLEWSKVMGSSYWGPAMAGCDNLVHDGKSDWRVPTLYEFQAASQHGMTGVANANWITSANMSNTIWTSTMNGNDDVSNKVFRPSDNNEFSEWKNSATISYVCIRP